MLARSSTLKDEQAAKETLSDDAVHAAEWPSEELAAAIEHKTPRPTGIPIEAFGAEAEPSF